MSINIIEKILIIIENKNALLTTTPQLILYMHVIAQIDLGIEIKQAVRLRLV